MNRYLKAAISIPFLVTICAFASGNNYKNFDVATYATVRDVVLMNDPAYLESRWEAMSKYVKYDKIYLETSRDMIIADQASLDAGRKFFLSKGLKVSGGITWTVDERNGVTYCYSDPNQLQKAIDIIQFTARNFDEILFDDWGFTNCKTDAAIAAKGSQSWSQYRLALMDKVGRELVAAAKAVNPKVKVIIKYPQWYDHYQETGFNLETQPKYFDGIYTGTETRDPISNPTAIRSLDTCPTSTTMIAAAGSTPATATFPTGMPSNSGLRSSPSYRRLRSGPSTPSTNLPCEPTERWCPIRG
jgi:hypothetical protein